MNILLFFCSCFKKLNHFTAACTPGDIKGTPDVTIFSDTSGIRNSK